MSELRIPFNRASICGDELTNIAQAVATGHISGDGPFTRRCHDLIERSLGVAAVLLTTSGTHALEMAAALLDLHPGDEVIVPSFTFVSTANAFVLQGARPVFADIRKDTLNLDESRLEELITPRTRVIAPVHYAGVGCEMDAIMEIARRHGLAVVEDNAHGLFGRYRGRWLGTFGCLAALSFHETKNFTCGEGGALLINDRALTERAEILREKGTNRSRFFRGQIDKYTWVDVGSSYLPADILAAFLCAQLEKREIIQQRRRRIWDRYYDGLRAWAAQNGVRLPVVPGHCEHSSHLFYLVFPQPELQEAFIRHMRRRGILCVFHYLPLHLSPMGRKLGGLPGQCPVTEWVSDRLVRLPLFHGLTDGEQEEIIAAIHEFTW